MEFKKIIFSGTCMCGHPWEDHHLCMVANPAAAKVMGDYIPGECLYYGCNENGGLDENGKDHCYGYIDRDNPDKKETESWKGTVRENDNPWINCEGDCKYEEEN